ncbi:hypothetical protein ACN27F_24885 [Solwaraspora sp. WMMB335]|uniref:hypothetical protein n=1 Tax=Solwaraspora sp. WMMB335 TaxID=3404118 RepID=UPI003B95454C
MTINLNGWDTASACPIDAANRDLTESTDRLITDFEASDFRCADRERCWGPSAPGWCPTAWSTS